MRSKPQGWHSRGYLPHFEGGEVPQFITFRLAGTLPAEVLDRWKWELRELPAPQAESRFLRLCDRHLDRSEDGVLRRQDIASLVETAVLHFDGEHYRIHCWTIMPNHVHVLMTPMAGFPLGEAVRSWKSYTGKRANRLLGRVGSFWALDYFDRYMRSDRQYRATVGYIFDNPVKAGLCAEARDWPYGSARFEGDHL